MANLSGMVVDDLVVYGRKGESERVEARLELFRRTELKLEKKNGVPVSKPLTDFQRRRLEKDRFLPVFEPEPRGGGS